jgi:hypothetical protein
MSTVAEIIPAPGLGGARRASGNPGARGPVGAPDPEVTERPKRRRVTAEYKLRILREADACKGDGDPGELTREEAEKVAGYLERDLQDAGKHLAETGQ